jgi:hypothetical protein
MKTMFLAAFAALSLGASAAYAAGGPPAGWEPPAYGAQAFTDHSNAVATQFLGPNTVLGKMFHHSNSNQVAATSSTKG